MPETDLARKFKEQSLLKKMFPSAVYDPAKGKEQITDYARKQMESGTNDSGSPVSVTGEVITKDTITGIEKSVDVLTDPNVAKIRPMHGNPGGSTVIYKDGTQVHIPKEQGGGYLYYSSSDLVNIKPGGTGSNAIFVFADGTESVADTTDAERASGNFFESGNWGPYVVGAAAAAYGGALAASLFGAGGFTAAELALGTSGASFTGGTMGAQAASAAIAAGTISEAGAALYAGAIDAGLTVAEATTIASGGTLAGGATGGFTAAELALGGNSVNFAGEGALGIGGAGSNAALGVGGAGVAGGTGTAGGVGAGVVDTGGAFGTGAIDAGLATSGAELGAAPYITQAAQAAGVTLSATQAAEAAAKLKAAADAAAAAGKVWTVQNYLNAANLALTAGATIAAIVDAGDKKVSTTTTTDVKGAGEKVIDTTGTTVKTTPTGTTIGGKTAGALSFEDFINDFYGLTTGSKSAQVRGVEDQTSLKGFQQTLLNSLSGLDATRLADTKTAVAPFQTQLADALTGEKDKTGYFAPFNYSFGGKAMPSFVPKNQINTMNAALGVGRESAQVGTGLVDQAYKSGTDIAGRKFGFDSENLPNKAADTYTAKLEALMKYFNPNGTTATTTGTVPGIPWYTTALQGLTTGVSLWDKINNPRTASSLTAADLAAIQAALKQA